MKKWIAFVLLLEFGTSASSAQTASFGPRIGCNLSTTSTQGLVTGLNSWKFGLLGGVAWDLDFENGFHFQPELYWIMKGAAERNQAQSTRTYSTYSYLQTDLLGKFDLTDRNEGIFMTLGPTVSYLLRIRSRTIYNGEETSDVVTDGSGYNRLDIGGAAGIGYALGTWTMEFRAQVGFSSIVSYSTTGNVTLGLHFTHFVLLNKEEEPQD